MEKTKFKLNYIHTHVKRSRLFKTQKQQTAKKHKASSSCSSRSSISIDSPSNIYRMNYGFLCFLDSVSNTKEYISFFSLMMHFLQIKEIRLQNNFHVCIVQDLGEPCVEQTFLIDKLIASADQKSTILAHSLETLKGNVQEWQILGFPDLVSHHHLLNIQQEPLIILHHNQDAKKSLSKIRINNFLKEISMKNEFEMFHEGLLLIPSEDYFSSMKNFVDGYFRDQNHVFTFHLNTLHGVFKIFAKIYQFEWEGELLTIFYFPRTEQSSSMQTLYDTTNKRLFELQEMKVPKDLPKKVQDIEDWNQMIKLYFEAWLVKEAKQVCSYKVVEIEQK